MIAQFYPDLNIKIYKSDVSQLLKGGLKALTYEGKSLLINVRVADLTPASLIIKEKAIYQLKFQFETPDFYLEGYHNNPELVRILGYDITLDKSTFEKNVNGEISHLPFWDRGFRTHCHFDRLHLTYEDFDGRNISRRLNPLAD
ncbi:hypothetical protein HOD75_03010 [archaeon]|jgi:hypothetical protein|nr:hypothetical protein [archaeon]MBT4241843.1 hypothetical protein [archaeon]MBT4418390.1 hypothetical protein [archaeon]